MDYADIERVNAGLSGIDVKGKNYVMVPQRVKAFRMLYPEGFIRTELISLDNGVCVMQSKAGYYDNGNEIVLGTGMAYEKETSSYINKTSYIENCETSSVGRCLGFLGLGIEGGGICSAEELANAINNQNRDTKPKPSKPIETNNAVTTTVPAVPAPQPTVESAFKSCMDTFMEAFEITDSKDALQLFNAFREKLQQAGAIPAGKKMRDADEVLNTFEAIYKNFKPGDNA